MFSRVLNEFKGLSGNPDYFIIDESSHFLPLLKLKIDNETHLMYCKELFVMRIKDSSFSGGALMLYKKKPSNEGEKTSGVLSSDYVRVPRNVNH